MLTEICQYLRNWFVRDVWVDDYNIENGVLTYADGTVPPLLPNQYYRIVGSVFNDGVHKLGDTHDTLTGESFHGAVWSMAVPPDFLSLVDEINAWVTANQTAINSPYQSESFGGYSYSIKSNSGATGENNGVTWENQFASRLNPWRKI